MLFIGQVYLELQAGLCLSMQTEPGNQPYIHLYMTYLRWWEDNNPTLSGREHRQSKYAYHEMVGG